MNPICIKLIQTMFILCLVLDVEFVCAKEVPRCIQREREALVDFKAGLVDHHGMLSSWSMTADCCQWKGIRCSNVTGHVLMIDLHGDIYSYTYITGMIHKSLMELQQLQYLNLSGNIFKDNNIPNFFGSLTNLRYLDLSDSKFGGKIPSQIGSLLHLKHLDLSFNHLEGSVPSELGNLSNLQFLNLERNSLKGNVPSQLGRLSKLEVLYLGGYAGALKIEDGSDSGGKWLSNLTALTYLNLREMSHLSNSNGWLQMIGKLPKIRELSLSNCGLSDHFILSLSTSKFNFSTSLSVLDLSFNSFKSSAVFQWVSNLSSNLVELDLSLNFMEATLPNLRLRSCKLGPEFPKWLKTQDSFKTLDISNAGISDTVPKWFWDILALQDGKTINISYNNLKGVIPNYPLKDTYSYLYLASNRFEGRIPPFLRGALILDLSKNQFSDSVSFLCTIGAVKILYQLDLSDNFLYGKIPNCWIRFMALAYLDLSHNKFSGNIPTSMGSLVNLQALLLRSNNLTDNIPLSLMNCTKLVMLDGGENRLSGLIPAWIGSKLQKLQVLSLGKNHFFGNLPLELCYLKKIQLLDLSLNKLSGRIPKCFKNFTSMTQKTSSRGYEYFINTSRIYSSRSYDLNAFLMWKGVEQRFKNNGLLLLKSIDLSSNQFSDEIPTDITDNLLELVSLNLSRNNLTGKIPSNIGKLASLEFLDLSRNQLTGSIPSSLVQIDRLAMLDFSHNHLSGRIPTSTQLQSFNVSSYENNLDLCGLPLEKLCIDKGKPIENIQEDEDLFITRGFYMSMAIGFFIGFWGIFGSILLNRSWRHAYFKFLNNLTDNIYVMIVVKYKRWLND